MTDEVCSIWFNFEVLFLGYLLEEIYLFSRHFYIWVLFHEGRISTIFFHHLMGIFLFVGTFLPISLHDSILNHINREEIVFSGQQNYC